MDIDLSEFFIRGLLAIGCLLVGYELRGYLDATKGEKKL